MVESAIITLVVDGIEEAIKLEPTVAADIKILIDKTKPLIQRIEAVFGIVQAGATEAATVTSGGAKASNQEIADAAQTVANSLSITQAPTD